MANSAVGLIEQINASSNLYNIASTAYGYCTTASGTQEKAVTIAGFKYIDGVTIHVKFQNANTADNPTLNVNSEGAYPMMQYGTTAVGTTNKTSGWQANAVVSFTYVEVDDTHKYWYRDSGYNTDTGTVTSVRVQASSPLQSSTNTAQSTSLNTTISFINQDPNKILAGPTSGSAAAPTFRSLVAADIPNLSTDKLTSGTLGVARGGTGAGTFATGEVLIGNGTGAITTLAIDSTVTANSSNLVTSGAVASAITGLTGAMHLIGSTSTALTDGATTSTLVAKTTGSLSKTTNFAAGDVVLYNDKEFVWTGATWELLGDEGSYALDDNVIHKNDFNNKGEIIYASGDNAYSILGANNTTTGKVLYMASSTPAWKQLGLNAGTWPTVSVTKTVTFLKTATLQTGTAFTVPNVTNAGSVTTASVTNAVLTITHGTATQLGTAFTIPNVTGVDTTGETALTGASINTSSATWPTIKYT